MENKMQIKKLKVEELKPAQYNPRKKLKPGDTGVFGWAKMNPLDFRLYPRLKTAT